ncbi:MAG: hypothetical protein CL879_03930 [Dehalococcoidia bacterium]|nr:hypothetical protein [Dehalococcoidia bacterium]
MSNLWSNVIIILLKWYSCLILSTKFEILSCLFCPRSFGIFALILMATTLSLLSPGALTFIDSMRPSINNRTEMRRRDF